MRGYVENVACCILKSKQAFNLAIFSKFTMLKKFSQTRLRQKENKMPLTKAIKWLNQLSHVIRKNNFKKKCV